MGLRVIYYYHYFSTYLLQEQQPNDIAPSFKPFLAWPETVCGFTEVVNPQRRQVLVPECFIPHIYRINVGKKREFWRLKSHTVIEKLSPPNTTEQKKSLNPRGERKSVFKTQGEHHKNT